MEITTRVKKDTIAEIVINTGNSKIVEDVCEYRKDKGWHVSESFIEQLITTAFDYSRFNGQSDVKTVQLIINAFLNDSEREELININTETGC